MIFLQVKLATSRFLILFGILLVSCNEANVDANEILAADRAFSAMSKEQGFPDAFIEYADPEAVIIRGGDEPLKGSSAIFNYYDQRRGSTVELTWEPIEAEIAGSGDLGYTYGRFYTMVIDSLGETKKRKGYYISVWRKQDDGSWKYVLDGGTSTVEVE